MSDHAVLGLIAVTGFVIIVIARQNLSRVSTTDARPCRVVYQESEKIRALFGR